MREKTNPQFYAIRISSIPPGILAFDIYKISLLFFPNIIPGNRRFFYFIVLSVAIIAITNHFTLKNTGFKELAEDMGRISKDENKKWKIIAWCYILVLLAIALGFILD